MYSGTTYYINDKWTVKDVTESLVKQFQSNLVISSFSVMIIRLKKALAMAQMH